MLDRDPLDTEDFSDLLGAQYLHPTSHKGFPLYGRMTDNLAVFKIPVSQILVHFVLNIETSRTLMTETAMKALGIKDGDTVQINGIDCVIGQSNRGYNVLGKDFLLKIGARVSLDFNSKWAVIYYYSSSHKA